MERKTKSSIRLFILIGAVVLLVAICLGGVYMFVQSKPENRINSFLTAIEKEKYKKAFRYLYCYDENVDTPTELSSDEAYEIWSERVIAVRKGGTYLQSHKDINITETEDSAYATATLVFDELGAPRTYKDLEIVLVQINDKWYIADISTETVLTYAEEAISGKMK